MLDDHDAVLQRAADLSSKYNNLKGQDLLRPLIKEEFSGRIALVSSFGTESAVLLQMVAAIDPAVPIIFIDTGKHFTQTLRYKDKLISDLGLKEVRLVRPNAVELAHADSDELLWRKDPDGCCFIRKVKPLAEALSGFDAWISGRKRYQGGTRAALPKIEADGGLIKINPMADLTVTDVENAFATNLLPRHPMEADGYSSIGCYTCSAPAAKNGDRRSGRWQGTEKTECGIHDGRFRQALQGRAKS